MRCRSIVLCGALLALVACSSTESGRSLAPASSVADSSTSSPTTSSPTTSTPTTSSTPAETTTTLPTVAGGWSTLDRDTVTGMTGFPCCASNWYGTPSPPLPQQGAPLPPDGSYAVTASWGTDVTAPLQLVLRRFEQCGELPAASCEDEGGTWSPDSLGVDPTTSFTLTVPLDTHLRVVLTGFNGFADSGAETAMAEGNGADLAELASAVESAHASVLMAKLDSGMTADQVVATVSAAPEGGFVAGLDGSEYSLSFSHGSAPALLFQAPFGFDDPGASRGTDALKMPSIQMIDGILTLYVYAGFYS